MHDLLGTIMKICDKISTTKRVRNNTCVLWFFFRRTIGVFIMQHSTYLGCSNIDRNSCFIFSGRLSLIKSWHPRPSLFFAALLAPFNKRLRTGRVDFSSSTDRMAKCKGVKPILSAISRLGESAKMKLSANSDFE